MKRLLIIPLLFVGLILQAQTYYIGPEGDDLEGDGSMGDPWASLYYACTQVTTPGSFIYVFAGTYNESNQIVKAVGVSITGTGNSSHIISTYSNPSALQASIQCNSAAGTTTNDNSSISYIKLTGSSLTATRAIHVGYRNNFTIHNVTIEDFLHTGIWLYVGSSYHPLYATGNKIYNCTITNSSNRTSGYSGCVRISGQSDFLVYGNTFDMTERAAGSNGNTFSLSYAKKGKIYNNTSTRNEHEIDAGGVNRWNFFLESWDYKGDIEYYSNTHHGHGYVSWGGEVNDIEAGCTFGVKMYGNSFLNATNGARDHSGGDGTIYAITVEGDQHQKVYIYNNYIQRYGWGIALSSPSSGSGYWAHYWEWDGVYVYYNIIENIGYSDHAYSWGIVFVMELDAAPYYGIYDNILIANNVITGNNGGSYQGYRGIHMNADGTFNGLTISNNIVYDFLYAAVNIQEQTSGTCVINNVNITYNDFYSNGTDAVVWDAAVAYTNRDIATGNITSNPLFVSSSDYRLQITSPCIDAGTSVSLTSDYAGNVVPAGSAPDIGAYEFASTPAPVTGEGFLKDSAGRFMIDSNGKILVIE